MSKNIQYDISEVLNERNINSFERLFEALGLIIEENLAAKQVYFFIKEVAFACDNLCLLLGLKKQTKTEITRIRSYHQTFLETAPISRISKLPAPFLHKRLAFTLSLLDSQWIFLLHAPTIFPQFSEV